ncbi:type II toxin-antitoxin system RelE/ParE family toxin [Desulforhopalus sp. 52FAK]
MVKITHVLQAAGFKKTVKKLHKNKKKDLDAAVRELMENPLLGEQKKGDLSYMRVYKFKMSKQLSLLGYRYENGSVILELLALGTHKNFYRNGKTTI